MARTRPSVRTASSLVAVSCVVAFLTACSSEPDHGAPGDAVLLGGHPTVDASPAHCTGRVGSVRVDGDLTVPAGSTCVLTGTVVEGNVSVGHGARLISGGVRVDGDIEGERISGIDVRQSAVGGNVQLDAGVAATLVESEVEGDVSWEDERGPLLARDNEVGGNLELEGNTGGVTVLANHIDGDLSCEANAPTPLGGGNTVLGNKKGQCHTL